MGASRKAFKFTPFPNHTQCDKNVSDITAKEMLLQSVTITSNQNISIFDKLLCKVGLWTNEVSLGSATEHSKK